MKKILIASPTADIKDYCLEDWMKNVQSFTYGNSNLFLCDNSEGRQYYVDTKKKYEHLGNSFEMGRVTPTQYPEFKYALAKSHDVCREKALNEGYDYLLHLESDVFPPSDVIERLLDSKKKVVGAMYHIELGERSTLMIQQLEGFGDGQVKKVFSCGLGCVLIHRSVLEKIQFRYEQGSPVHPDSFFYADLDAKGIPAFVDTSIYCEHRNHSTIRI
jgi:hypothetical protein